MHAYLSIFSARFRTMLQYRGAAMAGCTTQFFWGFIRIMIFDAFYRSTTAPQPMSREQVITYVWLGQGLLLLLPWSIDTDIRAMIRSGAVAYELVRPLDLYNLWLCRYLAARTAPAILRAVPLFLVAGLFLGLRPPPSLSCAVAWLISTAAALLLGCVISNLFTVSVVLTVSAEGLMRFLPALVYALSGMLVPILLLPPALQRIINFLPFRDLVDVPFRVYLGQIPPAEYVGVLTHQLTWAAVLLLLGRWAMSRGVRRLVVQGG